MQAIKELSNFFNTVRQAIFRFKPNGFDSRKANRPEAHALFEAQLAYRRGEIDKVYDLLRHATNKQEGIEVLSYIKQSLADGTFMP